MSLENDIQNYPIITRLWLLLVVSTSFLLKFNFVTQNELAWKNFNDVYKKLDYKKFIGGISQSYPVFPSLPAKAYFSHIVAWRWVIFVYLLYNFGKKVEWRVFKNSFNYLIFLTYNILCIQFLKEHIWTIVKTFNKSSKGYITLNPVLFNNFSTELVNFSDILILQLIAIFSFAYPRYNFKFGPISFDAKFLPFLMIFLEWFLFERMFSGAIAFVTSYLFFNIVYRAFRL